MYMTCAALQWRLVIDCDEMSHQRGAWFHNKTCEKLNDHKDREMVDFFCMFHSNQAIIFNLSEPYPWCCCCLGPNPNDWMSASWFISIHTFMSSHSSGSGSAVFAGSSRELYCIKASAPNFSPHHISEWHNYGAPHDKLFTARMGRNENN